MTQNTCILLCIYRAWNSGGSGGGVVGPPPRENKGSHHRRWNVKIDLATPPSCDVTTSGTMIGPRVIASIFKVSRVHTNTRK